MASGTLGDSNDDLNWRKRPRWTENYKVYSRKTHKKSKKTYNNNDTTATTTSAAEKPISAVHSRTHAEVSPASSPPIIPSSTNTPNGTFDGHAARESVGIVGAKVIDYCRNSPEHSQHHEQGRPHVSPDKKADSFHEAPLLEQEQSEHVASVTGDSYLTRDRVEEGDGSHAAELHNLDSSILRDTDEARDLERSEPSPIRENDLPNGRDDSAAQRLIGNEEQNDGVVQTYDRDDSAAQQPIGNEEQNDGVVQTYDRDDSAAQQPIGNEEQNDGVVQTNDRDDSAALQPVGNGPIKVNGLKSPHLVVDEPPDDVEMMPASPQVSEGNNRGNINGVMKSLVISTIDDRIRFNLCKSTPKNEIDNLKKNLEDKLDHVRRLVKELESKELHLTSVNGKRIDSNLNSNNNNNRSNSITAEGANSDEYVHSQPPLARNNVVDRRLFLRVNSEAGANAIAHHESRPIALARVNSDIGVARSLEPRLYNRQLSVSVMDNQSNEYVEKEKRTPKANQYYRNSEFLLGKDRLPSESNKRLKANNGRKHSGETEHSIGFGFRFDKNRNQVFKNCGSLLQRLMKHKFGWVFNEPVNVKTLGLVDYYDIIKHPMDLGTIKTRLSHNFYKNPKEFAEDVRLVFHNAMTYNPKGQDVHVMAEKLLQIFEERWVVIESDCNSYGKYQEYQDWGSPTPTSRKGGPHSHFGPPPVSVPSYAQRNSDRHEPVVPFMDVDPKIHRSSVGRTPVPKKPKAKDPNKRDMTYEEKQRLSNNLQGLPPEKLDAIVQIIKKRNTAVSQHDDEIEVDIDSVDAETLWELDRFVTNYKKSLSKNKRRAELALQARNQNVMLTNSTPAVGVQNESRTAFKKGTTLVDDEQVGNNGSRSSSSSSSSSDSGSTSSDSDSDSSSGSDAGHSPKT